MPPPRDEDITGCPRRECRVRVRHPANCHARESTKIWVTFIGVNLVLQHLRLSV